MSNPTFEDVFGELGYCACAHCRSVLGPAAYLTDLLQWLAARDTLEASARTWRDVLVGTYVSGTGFTTSGRRPDLRALKLNCENAERSLPYIDLVMEVLESAAVNSGAIAESAAHETVVESSAMLASPQYVSTEAYGEAHLLSSAICIDLPFHQPLQEARTFLEHLGVARVSLLSAFAQLDPETYPSADEVELCLEALGLWSSSRSAISTEPATLADEKVFWPLDTGAADAAWIAAFDNVGTLRRLTRLTWPDIQDLVHARFVNPRDVTTGDPRIQVQVSGDASDIGNYNLQLLSGSADLDVEDVTRIRQFVRLQRATGWSALILDRVLASTGTSTLSEGAQDDWTTELGNVRLLERMTGFSPTELASWRADTLDTWSDRDTRDTPIPSHYASVFLAPSVLSSEDTRLASWLLVDDELAGAASDTLGENLDLIAGALGLTVSALTDLIGALTGSASESVTSGSFLSLANVTTLFRWASIGRACGVAPADAWWLANEAALDPFSGNADHGRQLVRLARRILEAGWSVAEVQYVVAGEQGERAAPTEAFLQTALGRIRDAVRSAYAGLSASSTEETVREPLVRVVAEELGFDRGSLDSLRGLTWGAADPMASASAATFTLSTAAEATPGVAVSVAVPTSTVGLADVGSGAVRIRITAAATATIPATNTLDLPQGTEWSGLTPAEAELGATAAFTLGAGGTLALPIATPYVELDSGTSGALAAETVLTLEEDLEFAGPSAAVTVAIDVAVGWEADLLRFFLRKEFRDGGDESDDPLNPASDLTPAAFADDFTLAELLAKVAFLLRRLSLSERERRWWFDPESMVPGWEGPGFDEILSVTDVRAGASVATDPFDALIATITLFGLRARLPGAEPDFVDVLTAASIDGEAEEGATALGEALAERCDWVADDIDVIGGALRDAGDTLTSAAGLDALLARAALVRRVGASASTVLGWTVVGETMSRDESAEVVFAARSRAGSDAAWATVARPVRDRLRKAQRDALVAYLLGTSGQLDGEEAFEDADDLYQHYLIDVSMNPEMLTSRIVQAACSVQLFVHRLALGLERDPLADAPLAELNADDRKEWEWMRTYRVWEAARKVFLFPENWIEPELRDDITPFFKDLQAELAQADLTTDRVEDAALAYLDRLAEVAKLDILAHLHQVESVTRTDGAEVQAIDRLHVFARTRAIPASYFYACRDDAGIWGAWEKIECGVSGEHLVPLIHNRRLILCWLLFDPVSDGAEEPDIEYSVRVSWSEYRDGRWRPAQTQVAAEDGDVITVSSASETRAYAFEADGAPMISVTDMNSFPDSGFTTFSVALILSGVLYPNAVAPIDPEPGGIGMFAGTYMDYVGFPFVGVLYPVVPGYDEVWILEYLDPPDIPFAVFGTASHQYTSDRPFFFATGSRSWLVTPTLHEAARDTVEDVDDSREGTSATDETPVESTAAALKLAMTSMAASERSLATSLAKAGEALARTSDPSAATSGPPTFTFSTFYHPHVDEFLRTVRRGGIFALLDPDPDGPEDALYQQGLVTDTAEFDFLTMLGPTEAVTAYPAQETVAFGWTDPYAIYNWELFFHLPYHVGNELFRAGKHEEALRWFHCVFDPRGEAWWKVKPLNVDPGEPIANWFAFVGGEDAAVQAAFNACVAAWRDDPFNPHLIARLRPGVYSKAFVMRYVDNLLAWGDQLFTKDTIEANNEATQLYVFAKQLLGDRPETLEPATKPTAKTYAELLDEGTFDEFGAVVLENYVLDDDTTSSGGAAPELSFLGSVSDVAYFCVPFNDRLLSYWDTVADRLFKLRNGMNIAGVVRSLPLFQPPIDPALLVRASAAGVDLGTALDSLSVPLPTYRFGILFGRAQSLAGSVRGLLGGLLSALEKRDAEALALLRAEHETALAALAIQTREKQVEDAQATHAALAVSITNAIARRDYYQALLDKGWITSENQASDKTGAAVQYALVAASRYLEAGKLASEIDVSLGVSLNIVPAGFGVSIGTTIGGSVQARALMPSADATARDEGRARAASAWQLTVAQFARREQEWKFQVDQADAEAEQLRKQAAGAALRIEIADRELANQKQQAAYAADTQAWMQGKWTNGELYSWMSGQLSTLAFQSFQLALEVAKKAERAFQHETGKNDSFIGAVYWDSLRKGLLAGERLNADLERMDAAYLDADTREHEITKPIALSRLDPLALARLRLDGECYFAIPEEFFDLDTPGHYFRRIQSVALTIAAVAGQHGTVNAQLTMHGGKVRRDTTTTSLTDDSNDYPSIVTSVAIQDAGVFSADLKDPRYLPFERRGAISQWHLKLTAQVLKQLDWGSIADVVLHMRYTAKDGGALFASRREAALSTLTALILGHLDSSFEGTDFDSATSDTQGGATFVLSAKRDDPDTLYEAQQDETGSQTLSFEVTEAMLGALAEDPRTVVAVLAISTAAEGAEETPDPIAFTMGTNWTAGTVTLGGLVAARFIPGSSPSPDPTTPATTYTIDIGVPVVSMVAGDPVVNLDDLVLILVVK